MACFIIRNATASLTCIIHMPMVTAYRSCRDIIGAANYVLYC